MNFAYPKMHTPFPPTILSSFTTQNRGKIASIMSHDDDDSVSDSSLATPQPLRLVDNAAATNPPRETLSEMWYVSQGRSLKALALLSLGLTNDDGTPIFDLSVLPWSAAAPPSSLKLSAKELRCEVTRRCVAAENVLNAPRPGQWPVKKSTEWLIGNPIVAEEEVAFIKKTILDRVSVSERAGLEGVPSLPSSKSGGGNWVGKYPYLRLIHAIIDDNDIKTAYLRRLHIPGGRMAVENRNTEAARTSNVWYMVAEKWNDELFFPTTSIKDSHSDYSRPIAIPWESVEKLQPATPEKVEEKWNSMNLALKRAISNWERSGQGDGGITGEDDLDDDDIDGEDGDDAKRFGSLEGRSQRALDQHQKENACWKRILQSRSVMNLLISMMGVAEKILAGGRVCKYSNRSAYRDKNITDDRQYI